MSCNTTSQNYKPQYKEEEIYTSKTVIKYDEYGNVISRDTYYDKEIKYADRTNNLHTIQPIMNTSPSSSVPTSPTTPNSVSIDMSNISMYNY